MPYKSKAQQRFFHAVLEKEDPKMVKKWDKETKGKFKSLPEKKEPKEASNIYDNHTNPAFALVFSK